MLGHHFETKTPARPRHHQQIVHLSAGAPLRDQDTGNKSYILMLGHHFETKTPATNRASSCWGATSRPRHRQQNVHLSAGAPLRNKDIGNKSYILVLGHHFETKTPATIRTSQCGGTTSKTPATNRTSTKTPATNRTCQCWGTTSRPRHRRQIVHLSAGVPLRDQDTGNKSYILVLGHHFETKTPATNRASSCWGATSRPRHRQQNVHLSAGAPLRN